MELPIDVEEPGYITEDILIFRDAVEKFFDRECVPHLDEWEKSGIVGKETWKKAGEMGLLLPGISDEYGGGGGTFAHDAEVLSASGHVGANALGIGLHNAIVAPYIDHYGTEEQKRKWLPKMASGELIGAIAMTEPGTGSDLQSVKTTAKLDGNHYVINGQKVFITNGQNTNFIIVVTKTDASEGAKGVSLIVVETDEVEGFRRGRNLDKIGMKGQDTSELFFDNVRVPTANLIGTEEGQGFVQLMEQLPQERLMIAIQGVAMMERALNETIAYVKDRKAFGKRILDFQNTKFKLAECKTEATVAKVFVNHCTELLLEKKLDATKASMAKYWVSDIQGKVIDECLQLFGGWGYMNEFPIARMYRDARVQRIYGGTNEIMKVLIARSL